MCQRSLLSLAMNVRDLGKALQVLFALLMFSTYSIDFCLSWAKNLFQIMKTSFLLMLRRYVYPFRGSWVHCLVDISSSFLAHVVQWMHKHVAQVMPETLQSSFDKPLWVERLRIMHHRVIRPWETYPQFHFIGVSINIRQSFTIYGMIWTDAGISRWSFSLHILKDSLPNSSFGSILRYARSTFCRVLF